MNSFEIKAGCKKTFDEYMEEHNSLVMEFIEFINSSPIEELRMDKLEHFLQTTKAYHWRSYYHGWINGRIEMLSVIKGYKAILEQIASDFAALQNDPDDLWSYSIRDFDSPLGKFYDRMCANITDYESLNQKE